MLFSNNFKALVRHQTSWWHRIMHWLKLHFEEGVVYFKPGNPHLYNARRCVSCGFEHSERLLAGPKNEAD